MDVQRLKACIGKPGKSVVHLIAASVDSNTFIAGKLEEYLAKSPAMLLRGKEVSAGIRTLEELPLSAAGVSKLMQLAKALPGLQQSLRSGATVELTKAFRGGVDLIWDYCKALPNKSGILLELQSLLVECGILFPLDDELNTRLSEVAGWRQQESEEQLLSKLQESCALVESVADGDADAYADSITSLQSVLSSTGRGTAERMDEQTRQKLQRVGKSLMAFAKEAKLDGEESVKLAHANATLGMQLGEFLSIPSMQQEFALVKETVQLVESQQKVNKNEESDAGQGKSSMKVAIELQRKLHRVLESIQQPQCVGHPCQEQISAAVEQAKQTVATLKTKVIESCRAALDEKLETLREIAGGGKDGKGWLENFTGASFDELVAHATQTLLVMDGKALVAGITEVTQAI